MDEKFIIPLIDDQEVGGDPPAASSAAPHPGPATTLTPEQICADFPQNPTSRQQVLVVEDEALIALMIKDILVNLGIAVVGPVSTVALAVAAANGDGLRAALLDVNLGTERVYPVADVLAARNIPFVFVTGFGATAIDRRYAHVPTLEKPINPKALADLFARDTWWADGVAAYKPSSRRRPSVDPM